MLGELKPKGPKGEDSRKRGSHGTLLAAASALEVAAEGCISVGEFRGFKTLGDRQTHEDTRRPSKFSALAGALCMMTSLLSH